MRRANGSSRESTYHVEQLDHLRERVARLEGEKEAFATKEDVANAKIQMYVSWVGSGIAILVGVGVILARLWPVTN